MYLIVGLGNIGSRFEGTYHNMGFAAVEKAAKLLGVKFKKRQGFALTAEAFFGGEKIILAKPETFMNLSGDSVKCLAGIFKPEIEKILIVYDDIDIPAGKIRIRPSGSAGSHNGMKSIIEKIGAEGFPRIRIGRGAPPEYVALADYVLSEPDRKTRGLLNEAVENAAAAIIDFVKFMSLDNLMQKYN
jgi:PTH1 family peptidyl-tRNA hydrolase